VGTRVDPGRECSLSRGCRPSSEASLFDLGSETTVSDLSSKGRAGLASAEPGGSDQPPAKPIAAASFIHPAAGARPALRSESYISFRPAVALEDFGTDLRTTGFERVDESPGIAQHVAPEKIAAPVIKPILEVRPSAAPITVYEPMEFIDYDDDDDTFGDVQPEPEPEPPPPPVLTEFLPVALPTAAEPGRATLEPGLGTTPFCDLSLEIPDLAMQTLRKTLTYGPNPFAPKPEPIVEPQSEPAPVSTPLAATAKPAPTKTASAKPAPSVVQRPVAAAATVNAEPAARPDREKRKAVPPPPSRPVRDRGNAVPVEEEIPEIPAPALKPKMVPIRKPEPLAPAAVSDAPVIGLPQAERSGGSRIAIVAAAFVVLAGGGYFMFSGSKSAVAGSGTGESISGTSSPGMVIGGGGWTTTWGADAPNNKGKQIAIYRPSMTMPDYRFEFRGEIERKAMGWIFRAQNPKTYYVMKLEVIKPGVKPLVALVKYAVIDGKETTRTQVMLPFEVKTSTVYQVRLDVKGDKFTTYVQDKLVDYWTDDRIKLGGTGFYTETGERSQIKSSQVSYLK
jgi:hypothetical protein